MNKEEEIGSKNVSSNCNCSQSSVTLYIPTPMRKIGCNDEGTRTIIHSNQVDEELSDLEGSEVLFPPNLSPECGSEEIVVHQNVNGEVKGDWNPLHCTSSVKLAVSQPKGHGVVVPMKELQILLGKDKENSIQQFVIFKEIIDVIKQFQFVIVCKDISSTNGIPQSAFPKGKKFFNDGQ